MLIEYGNTVVVPEWELCEKKPTGFTRIYYVHSGDVTYEAGDVKTRLTPGRVYALPSVNSYHVFRSKQQDFSCTYLHVDFSQAKITGLIELDVLPGSALESYLQAIMHAIDEEASELLEHLAEGLSLFLRASSHFQPATQMLTTVQEYVMRNISAPISIEALAGLFSYHPNYFIHLFRQESGMTPHQFILRLRMQYAVMLLNTGMGNQAVGYACGYTDASTFTRAFRQYYGVTPQKYAQGFRSYQ